MIKKHAQKCAVLILQEAIIRMADIVFDLIAQEEVRQRDDRVDSFGKSLFARVARAFVLFIEQICRRLSGPSVL